MGSRESCVHFRAHPAEAMCLPQSEAQQRHNKKCDICIFFSSPWCQVEFSLETMISLAWKKPIAKPMNGMMILQPVPQGWDLRMLVDFPTCFVGRIFILYFVEFFCAFVFFLPIFLVPPTVPCSLFLSKFGIIFGFLQDQANCASGPSAFVRN